MNSYIRVVDDVQICTMRSHHVGCWPFRAADGFGMSGYRASTSASMISTLGMAFSIERVRIQSTMHIKLLVAEAPRVVSSSDAFIASVLYFKPVARKKS